MSLYESALADDAQRFESAACAHAGSWLDALVDAIPDARRRDLEAALPSADPPYADPAYAATYVGRGRDAGWVLLAWVRDQIATMQAGPDRRVGSLVLALRAFAGVHLARVESAWLRGEIIATIPNHKSQLLSAVLVMGELPVVVMKTILSRSQIPLRRPVADLVRRAGGIDEELACAWLDDRVLRPMAREWLSVDVASHEDALRDLLSATTTGLTRETIVRLLRVVDPKLALDGRVHATDDGELQSRLRADPYDAMTAEIWADALADRGDPRGEYVALELAIRRSEPAAALELSTRQAEVWAEHRKLLFGKPGGFPFREQFRGRAMIGFTSNWNHKIRATRPENLLERVEAFIEHVTTAPGPERVYIGRRHTRAGANAISTIEPAPLLADLARTLGGAATAYADRDGAFVRRHDPEAEIADPDVLRALLLANTDVTLEYAFQLVHPGTTVRLPHQEPGHYVGDDVVISRLLLHLGRRAAQLVLRFPFEFFDEPGFIECYEAICDTLGRTMTPSRWSTRTPSADGRKLVSRLRSYAGPRG